MDVHGLDEDHVLGQFVIDPLFGSGNGDPDLSGCPRVEEDRYLR